MRNIRLTLAFDGSNFHGYQIQKNAHTIEAELMHAITKITQEDVKIIGCGRTDTGVHALSYTVNFKTNSKISVEKFPTAINGNIHSDIAVVKAEEAPDDFHARFSAREKTYVYRILNSKIPNPFLDKHVHRYGGKLDYSKMQSACGFFIGEHDFSSHKSLGTETATSIRNMIDCYITKNDDLIEIYMTANGFLYNMARTIAGTILCCGNGSINPLDIPCIIESKNRELAGATLPARGLFMMGTKY